MALDTSQSRRITFALCAFPFLKGRQFTESDTRQTDSVAIISTSFQLYETKFWLLTRAQGSPTLEPLQNDERSCRAQIDLEWLHTGRVFEYC